MRRAACLAWPFIRAVVLFGSACSASFGGGARLPTQTDCFGGDVALAMRSTGHFRLEEANGRWWLVTPEGHGMIALGVNHLSEMKNAAVIAPTVFARRFGRDWSRVFAEVEEQCRGWGFNSAGFQTPVEMRGTMPYVISTSFVSASFWQDPLAYVDVFTAEFAAEAEAKAVAAAAEMKTNPMAIAWTWTDSTSWDIQFTRQSRGTDYVSFMRELPADAPGRQRYTAFLRERHGGDLARLNAAYGTAFPSFAAVGGATMLQVTSPAPLRTS